MYLDQIREKFGCKGIEMETAAVFAACAILGFKATVLLHVSDVCENAKSLFSGCTEEEQKKRKMIRRTKMPKLY